MKKSNLVYLEIVPDEGKILYDGSTYTDYVCILETAFNEDDWQEVDLTEAVDLTEENDEENKEI